MAANASNNKDKEMASHLKKRGVKRTGARCPICNKIVALNNLYKHIVLHS